MSIKWLRTIMSPSCLAQRHSNRRKRLNQMVETTVFGHIYTTIRREEPTNISRCNRFRFWGLDWNYSRSLSKGSSCDGGSDRRWCESHRHFQSQRFYDSSSKSLRNPSDSPRWFPRRFNSQKKRRRSLKWFEFFARSSYGLHSLRPNSCPLTIVQLYPLCGIGHSLRYSWIGLQRTASR